MFAGLTFTTPGPDTAPSPMYAAMAFSYLGAMLASNHALQYVSYPTQVRQLAHALQYVYISYPTQVPVPFTSVTLSRIITLEHIN